MERIRPRKKPRKFRYEPRDKQTFLERYGWAKKPHIVGTETMLRKMERLERSKDQVLRIEEDIHQFLDKRPRLKTEFDAWLKAGGGTRDDLKAWLKDAAQRPQAIYVRDYLALVVDNTAEANSRTQQPTSQSGS